MWISLPNRRWFYPALLALVTAVFASAFLLPNQLGFMFDVIDVNFRHTNFAFNMLWAGHPLFWNPFAFNGDVWLGQPLVGIFNPLNWLLMVLFRGFSLQAFMIQFWLTTYLYLVGLYALFTVLGIPRFNAFAAALIVPAFFLASLCGGDRYVANAATVWMLVGLIGLMRTLQLRFLWILIGACFLFLTAYPAFYFHILLLLGSFIPAYALLHLRLRAKNLRRLAALLGLAGLVVLGVCAVQIVPALEPLLGMGRAIPFDFVVTYPVGWHDLWALFFNWDAFPIYWGPSALLCFAFVALERRKLADRRTPIAALFSFLVMYSYMQKGVIFRVLFHFPLFSKVRQIHHIDVYLGLCLSIIGAYFVDRLIRSLKKIDRRQVLALLGALVLMVGLEVLGSHKLKPSTEVVCVAILAALGLAWKHRFSSARTALIGTLLVTSLIGTLNNFVHILPKQTDPTFRFSGPETLRELVSGIHPKPVLPVRDNNRKVSDFCVWHQWDMNEHSSPIHAPCEMTMNIITLDHRSSDLPGPQLTTLAFLPTQAPDDFRFNFEIKNGKNISLLEPVFSFYENASLVDDAIPIINRPGFDPFSDLLLNRGVNLPQSDLITNHLAELPHFAEVGRQFIKKINDGSDAANTRYRVRPRAGVFGGPSGRNILVRFQAKVVKKNEIDFASNLTVAPVKGNQVLKKLAFHPEQDGNWHPYTLSLGPPPFDQVEFSLVGLDVRDFEIRNVSVVSIPDNTRGLSNVEIYPNSFSVRSDKPRGGILLLTDRFHPSWRAYVDGRQVPILRALNAFKAIVLPKGPHLVEFLFRPYYYLWGALVTAMTALVLIAARVYKRGKAIEWLTRRLKMEWK